MKLMVCYDESEASQEALRQARIRTELLNAEVFIVTSFITEDRFHEKEIETAKQALKQAEAFFKEKNLPCRTHLLLRGLEPGQDLLQFARENEIDEILIGVKRRSRVGKILLGSIVPYMILHADCPVLSVKKKETKKNSTSLN